MQQVIYLFIRPDYSATTTVTYTDFTSNTDKVEMDTQFSTVAVSMRMYKAADPELTPEQLVRVQFQQAYLEDGGKVKYRYFPVIKCNQLYAREIEESEFFKTEFSNDSWLCPNVSEIEIFNNPFLFEDGSNFVVVINDCTIATEIDKAQGIESYSDAQCKSFEDAQPYIPNVRVNWKIMSQIFNPDYYKENGALQSVIKRRMNTDLMTLFS